MAQEQVDTLKRTWPAWVYGESVLSRKELPGGCLLVEKKLGPRTAMRVIVEPSWLIHLEDLYFLSTTPDTSSDVRASSPASGKT